MSHQKRKPPWSDAPFHAGRPERNASKRGLEIIFGKHSARAVFAMRPRAIQRVLILSEKWAPDEEFLELSRRTGLKPEILPLREFVRLAGLTEEDKHQGICLFAKPMEAFGQENLGMLTDAYLVLVLDQISNPKNLGTILRNAAFFGADAVVWLKDRSVDLSSTAYRVAVGGAEYVKIFKVANIAQTLESLKQLGFWVYGLDERGEKTLAESNFDAKTVFVVGAEGQGLRERTRALCDFMVRIPGGRKGVESLNAGVATAVALAEFFREPKCPSRTTGVQATGRVAPECDPARSKESFDSKIPESAPACRVQTGSG